MGQRIRNGTLAIFILVMVFAFDVLIARRWENVEGAWGDLLRRGSVLPLFFVVVSSCGAIELSRMMRVKAARPHALWAHLMIVVLLLTPWLSAAGWLGSGAAQVEGLYWQIVWLIVAGIGTGVVAVVRREPDGSVRDVGATLILILFLGFLGSFGLQLRCGRDVPGQEGAWLLLVALLVTKASDIGAYFGGSTLGRHKLAPRISPAKSVEGVIGGMCASALAAMMFASVAPLAAPLDPDSPLRAMIDDLTQSFAFTAHPGAMPPLLRAALFGFAMSAAGQLGDLLESCFKRDAGVKDSGRSIPPFGGILDMIDSPVLAMPVAWFLLTAVWNVV